MDKVSLKQVLRKQKELIQLIDSLAIGLNARVRVEEEGGNLLWTHGELAADFRIPVLADGQIAGWVSGDENAPFFASLLAQQLGQESGRIKMGREVLNLYREINLIFNFSEKIAQTIDPREISRIALEEAGHVIPSDYGAILFWDESSRGLTVEASTDTSFFEESRINQEFHLLLGIILNGQSDILGGLSALKEHGIIPEKVSTLMYAALKVKHRIMGAFILGSGIADQFTAASLKLLTTISLQSASAIESSLLFEKNIRESRASEEAMRQVLEITAKFVPGPFIRSLGHKAITDVKLGDQAERQVTVLFTDIRDYTRLSESMTPEATFAFICSLNEHLGPVIRRHNGFINQYLGDSIMAIFPGDAGDALQAAIAIQQEVKEFNLVRSDKELVPVRIGIGMHTGPLIMGITGDLERLDACTISDTVNTASRVESLTKHYHTDILLSEASLNQIPNPEVFHLRNLGQVQLKGKLKSITIYECFDCNEASRLPAKVRTLPLFQQAITLYTGKSYPESRDAFREVLEQDPGDQVARFFYEYIYRVMGSGMPEQVTGIVAMEEK